VDIIHRYSKITVIVLVLMGVGLSLLLASCGSASIDEYEQEVSELDKTAAEGLEETARLLGVRGV